jgi:hypothetical protein
MNFRIVLVLSMTIIFFTSIPATCTPLSAKIVGKSRCNLQLNFHTKIILELAAAENSEINILLTC